MNDEKILLQDVLDALTSRAEEEFLKSEEGELLTRERAQMDRSCQDILTSDEWQFVQETYSSLLHMEGRKREFAYRKGMRDCVMLLKALGVLA